jgi:hypothetical protein
MHVAWRCNVALLSGFFFGGEGAFYVDLYMMRCSNRNGRITAQLNVSTTPLNNRIPPLISPINGSLRLSLNFSENGEIDQINPSARCLTN